MRFIDMLEAQDGFPRFPADTIVIDASELQEQINISTEFSTVGLDPVCVPPFSSCPVWVECINDGSNMVLTEEYAEAEKHNPIMKNREKWMLYKGVFFVTTEARGEVLNEPMSRFLSKTGTPVEAVRWQSIALLFGGGTRKDAFGDVMANAKTSQFLHFDHAGRLIGGLYNGLSNSPVVFIGPENTPQTIQQMYAELSSDGIGVPLLAFDFLNQRTEVDEITPSRAEKRQAARAFGQKGTYPLRNYYMLKVKPQKPGYTGPPQPLRQSGIGKRLHAVRGHFRRVPDTGLFGRGDKAGELLWIPNHTRGDSSLGEIVKGYKVEPGDN